MQQAPDSSMKSLKLSQCFHFEGNYPNSGKSGPIPGNFREMKKFQEIPGNPKIMTYKYLPL